MIELTTQLVKTYSARVKAHNGAAYHQDWTLGYDCYWQGVRREAMNPGGQCAGWDYAKGERAYLDEMYEDAQANDSVGASESTQPYNW